MTNKPKINLEVSSILNVPLNTYDEFTFVVNDQNYKTTKIIADLISNKICQMHINDPTIDTFYIKTKSKGNFSKILELSDFKTKEIIATEIPFYTEIFDQLECKCLNFSDKKYEVINNENLFEQADPIEDDEGTIRNSILYSKYDNKKIHYIASHFYEIYQKYQTQLLQLPEVSIRKILSEKKLRLESEDQLIDYINQLCYNNKELASLYEYVNFQYVSVSKMNEFLNIFDFYYLTNDSWKALCRKLLLTSALSQNLPDIKRYQKSIKIDYNSSHKFNGILNYIRTKQSNNVFNEIKITSSSVYDGDDDEDDEEYSPQNVIQYENSNVEFCTYNQKNSWICFDFIDHQISPSYYAIRSCNYEKNSNHPKSWIIEGSNDNINWDVLDKHNSNAKLNGANLVASFSIQNIYSKKYRFLRMRQLKSWNPDADFFNINNIEFFGTLI